MTTTFERLQADPQTDVTRSDFPPAERALVRKLAVTGSPGRSSAGDPIGSFTPVYYIEGDESAAARKFVAENADELARIDFSASNVLATSLPRDLYDLVLHHAGERERTLYPTVVREDRRDGTTWLLDREYYEHNATGRYTTGSAAVAKVPPTVGLNDVFQQADSPIKAPALRAAGIEGKGVEQVLDYYRVSADFDCQPATVDADLAIIKD